MAAKITHKLLFVFCVLLFRSQLLPAQDMKMDTHEMTIASKNIYLAIMDTMMIKMDAMTTSPNPDLDFLAKMIPHHEGAIEMARYEIAHGINGNMRQLAKSILAEQSDDIQMMKIIMAEQPANSKKADPSFEKAMTHSMVEMMQNMPANDQLTDADRSFAMVMIPHHQAAINMATAVIQYPGSAQAGTFAKQLISAEQAEIEQMRAFIK